MSRSRLIGFFSVLTLVLGLAAVQAPVALAAGTTWLVNNTSPSCSDSGLGTSATAPFCTITKAATLATHAGDHVIVSPGTYAEQVTAAVTTTATAVSPITFTGPGAVLAGTSDFSTGWVQTAPGSTVWSRPVPLVLAPSQVLLDRVALAAPILGTTPTTMAARSFFYDLVAKVLYVDAGVADLVTPPGHSVVGTRTNGFKVSNTHDVVVQGFTTTGQTLAGVNIQSSTGITVSGVTATNSTSYGILAQASTAVTVTNATAASNGSVGIRFLNTSGSTITNSSAHDNGLHGISLQTSPNNVVAGNTSSRNVNPVGVHVATGIDVSLSSTGVTVERNTTFGNSDSGIEIYTGSNNAVVRRNVSYDNGDHGLDCLSSLSESVVGNTVVGNTTAGINLEGTTLAAVGCAGSVVANNISSDNGMGASANTHGDIRLDKLSWQGSAVNRNLVFRSDGGFLYEWNASATNLGQYSTVAAFNAATGQEANGIAADPRFTNLAARDLRLQVSSPAIDSADLAVPSAVALDHDGRAPIDNPDVANTGAGIPNFDDRGALEGVAKPMAPTAVLAGAGNAQALVAWTAPVSNGGSPITGYTVTASPGGGSATTAGATTATVSGLTNGTSYTFTVTATNAIGISPASVASAAVTPGVVTAPAPPTGVTATPGNAQASVSWTPPVSNGGAAITSYMVTASPGGRTATTTATTAIVIGLANGTSYTFSVTATNAIGTSPASVASAAVIPKSSDQRYVTRVYLDLFNRAPDAGGLAGWTAALSHGTPRVAVANAITSSSEYRSTLIAGSYQHFLGRLPDPVGLRSWLAAMRRGLTISQMESGFIASAEYYSKSGSTNAGWVRRLYGDVLGRSAFPTEVASWTARLRTGTPRARVAMGFLLSTERLNTVVDGYYVHLLGRHTDPSGQRLWVARLQAGGRNEAIIGGIIASTEYYTRA